MVSVTYVTLDYVQSSLLLELVIRTTYFRLSGLQEVVSKLLNDVFFFPNTVFKYKIWFYLRGENRVAIYFLIIFSSEVSEIFYMGSLWWWVQWENQQLRAIKNITIPKSWINLRNSCTQRESPCYSKSSNSSCRYMRFKNHIPVNSV